MTSGANKVKAAVDAMVFNITPIDTGLVFEILIVLLINEINYRPPAGGRQRVKAPLTIGKVI